jgi:hypothetical protein
MMGRRGSVVVHAASEWMIKTARGETIGMIVVVVHDVDDSIIIIVIIIVNGNRPMGTAQSDA